MLPSGCRAARLPLARLLSIYVDVVGNRSPIAIAGGQPVRRRGVRISAEVYLCVTNQGPSRHPAPGHDSYRISRRMASHPRKPGGRDLAEVALSGPPMTHPDTIRPHQGPK